MPLYLSLRDLPDCAQPCFVYRCRDSTLLYVHRGARRFDVVCWCTDHLTRDEQNALRAGLGQPPVGSAFDPRLLEGWVSPYVPPTLRLPQEAHLWGGGRTSLTF